MDQANAPYLRKIIDKYGYVLLILVIGILLMLFPTSSKTDTAPAVASTQPTEPEELQEQLSAFLSQMEGAGKVRVLLTKSSGERILYQTDTNTSGASTVIINDNSRNQSGLIQRIDPPAYLGAVILCQGADYPSVRLSITEAVSNATGLGFDKITILKMK